MHRLIQALRPRALRLLALAVLAAALAAPLGLAGKPAERVVASHTSTCTDPDITEAYEDVTDGEVPLGAACNPQLYNNGAWANVGELKTHVKAVLESCGTSPGQRNLVHAILEATGERPYFGSCSQALYQQHVEDAYGDPYFADWNELRDGTGTYGMGAKQMVDSTLALCSQPRVTQAVMERAVALPKRAELAQPSTGGPTADIGRGQCNSTLYSHTEYLGFNHLRRLVAERRDSTHTCSGSTARNQIQQAYVELTGWNPLPAPGPGSPRDPNVEMDECEPANYGGGSWSSYEDLKNLIYHSWRCRDSTYIGQIYYRAYGRAARGRGGIGECSPILYGQISTGTLDFPGGYTPAGFQNLRERVVGVIGAFSGAGYAFRASGGVDGPNGVVFDADEVFFQNANGVISTGGGNIISDNGGGWISTNTGNVIATGGGNAIMLGGAAVISTGGGNATATGGGNVISTGGGNAIQTGPGN